MSLLRPLSRLLPLPLLRSFGSSARSLSAALPTPLLSLHASLGGSMVDFAGYELPIFYKSDSGGVLKEHFQTRERAGLFDVSHMGQIKWHGKDAKDFIETVVVGDIRGLEPGTGCLSLIMNEEGGIMDDTVISNAKEGYVYMVVNGACKHKDMAHFEEQLKAYMAKNPDADVCMDYMDDTHGLIAIQGPSAAAATAALLPALDLSKVDFMSGFDCELGGVPGCRLTRCGYTGEDGFELSVPAEQTEQVARMLLEHEDVDVAGLGARDSLRLEAGLCLYGNDLDESITPTQGALGWTMGGPKGRRRKEQGFLGAGKFLTEEGKFRKISKKRVGLMGHKAPARGQTEIYDEAGEALIGVVTSGTMSPCLKRPVAMGYVESAHAKAGTKVTVDIRGKKVPTEITAMPFVETHYYRAP